MTDAVGERRDEVRKVREFLYVDLQRIRSYYTQLNRGIIDSVVSRDIKDVHGEAQARLLGFGAGAGGGFQRAREESRSLQDLNYVIFEELFEKEGLIRDIDELVDDPTAWGEGRVHGSIDEGSIIRYTGLIQILDPKFVQDRINQLIRLVSAFVGTQIGEQQSQAATPPVRQGGSTRSGQRAESGEQAREKLKQELLKTVLSGTSIGQIKDIAEMIAAFTNDAISVRVLPCGLDHPEYHFAGTLLSRSEYIQEEREALFARYGTKLEDWTVVMQVARIPPKTVPSGMPKFDKPLVNADEIIERTAFERMVVDLIAGIEGMGLAEGSRHPAISTTILAIYREFA